MPKYPEPMTIGLSYAGCLALSETPGEGVRHAVDVAMGDGMTFLRLVRDADGSWRTELDPDAASSADSEGCFISPRTFEDTRLAVPFFAKDVEHPPTAELGYIQDYRCLDLTQSYEVSNPIVFDDAANRLLSVAVSLYPKLRPIYGYVDAEPDVVITEKSVTAGEIRYLFWANVFGPDFVKQYGRDFLMNAPGWKKEELNDGGILYIVTEGLSEWIKEWHWNKKPSKEVMDYLRSRMPKIKVTRPEPSYD